MDHFTNLLATFLDLGTYQLCCCLWSARKLSDFIKNILICVQKTNKGLTGLERHKGEFSFFGELYQLSGFQMVI